MGKLNCKKSTILIVRMLQDKKLKKIRMKTFVYYNLTKQNVLDYGWIADQNKVKLKNLFYEN